MTNLSPSSPRRDWRATLPMHTALIAVAAVWLLGCVWSFQEQSAFAASRGFAFPHLLPLVIDGFAVSMAGVSWAASLDARPAVPARLAMLLAVATSSASNGVWAYLRAAGDAVTVSLGVAVPVAATLAFEVLLAELRRQVQRRRGLPAPVAVPYPRLIRLVLAPWRTFRAWRELVLELTDLTPVPTTPLPPVLAAGTAENQAASAAPEPTSTHTGPPASTASEQRIAAVDQPIPAKIHSQALARPTAIAEPATATVSAPEPAREPAPEPPQTREPKPAAARPRTTTRRTPAPRPANRSTTRRTETPVETAGDLTVATVEAEETPQRPAMSGTDPRAIELAHMLAQHEDAEGITGEMVGPLLRIEIAPRTGRRLLGQARELLKSAA